ncbi:uncharacterized protein [Porites lutea]|uniref:uncharacterized protein isoform X1 n=1 Tax=Porites lutea TaxID=51062 RepID=UPI003CC678BC
MNMASSHLIFRFLRTCGRSKEMGAFCLLVLVSSLMGSTSATSLLSLSSIANPTLSTARLQVSPVTIPTASQSSSASVAATAQVQTTSTSSSSLAAIPASTSAASTAQVQTTSTSSSSLAANPAPTFSFSTAQVQTTSTSSSSPVATPAPTSTASNAQAQTVSVLSSSLNALISPSSSSVVPATSASVAVDPCKQSNGGCAHNCMKNGTTYNCSCDPGFQLESDLHKCADLDECNSTTARHKCEHICVNTVGSYACACKPGHKLQMDGLSCKESTDPKPTSKAKEIQKWNWIILGIVIGLIALNILILVAGVFAKRVMESKRRGEGIAGSSTREMTAVKPTNVVGTANDALQIEA